MWIYIGVGLVVFLFAFVANVIDTFKIFGIGKKHARDDVLGIGWLLEDFAWDFMTSFVIGLLWPVFVLFLVIGGVERWLD